MSMQTFKRRQDVLLDMLNEEANVDVAFVVDCTRSMDKVRKNGLSSTLIFIEFQIPVFPASWSTISMKSIF